MKILSAFCLLALVICASSERCRDIVITPCTCKNNVDTGEIIVRCDNIEITLDDLRRVLNRINAMKDVALALTGLNLGRIPSNFFNGVKITHLVIRKCIIHSAEGGERDFLGLENSLKVLTIHSSLTDEERPLRLNIGHLRKLERLALSHNTINELNNDWLDSAPPSLMSLTLNGNGIKIIGDRVFSNLFNLEYITLEDDNFEAIKRSMFPDPAQKLLSFRVENNSLPLHLPEDLFNNMPALDIVYMRHNGISRLEQKPWKAVWEQLHYCVLEANPLRCDDHMKWMSQLQHSNYLWGWCSYPNSKRGMTLSDFIRGYIRELPIPSGYY